MKKKVPKTIISRCTRVLFGKAKKGDILKRLEKIVESEKQSIDKDVLEFIAKHSESSFRDANKILEELITQNRTSLEQAQQYIGLFSNQSFLEIISAKPLNEAMKWLNTFVENGGSVKNLIEESLEKLRVAMLVKNGITVEDEERLDFSISEVAQLMKYLNEAYTMIKISPIESIPLEIALVEFYNGRKGK